MRRFLPFTLALVAGFFVLGVPSAVAGGPTSVLLANYETGRSAAALNGSSAYTELQSILGDENPPAKSSSRPVSSRSRARGPSGVVDPRRQPLAHRQRARRRGRRLGRDLPRHDGHGPLRRVADLAPARSWRRPRHEPDRPGRPRDGHIRRRWVDGSAGGCGTGRGDRHGVRAFDVGCRLAAGDGPRGGWCPGGNGPGHAAGSSWAVAPPRLPPRRGHGVGRRQPAASDDAARAGSKPTSGHRCG